MAAGAVTKSYILICRQSKQHWAQCGLLKPQSPPPPMTHLLQQHHTSLAFSNSATPLQLTIQMHGPKGANLIQTATPRNGPERNTYSHLEWWVEFESGEWKMGEWEKRKKGGKDGLNRERSTNKVLMKRHLRANVVAFACKANTWEMRIEDCEFKSILGFKVRTCFQF